MPVGTMKTEYTIRIHNLQNSTKVYTTYNHICSDKKSTQKNMKEYDK
jgi:hypothetical protein